MSVPHESVEAHLRLRAVGEDADFVRLDAIYVAVDTGDPSAVFDALALGETPLDDGICRVERTPVGRTSDRTLLVDVGRLSLDSGLGVGEVWPSLIPGYVAGIEGVLYASELPMADDGISLMVPGDGDRVRPHRIDLPPVPSLRLHAAIGDHLAAEGGELELALDEDLRLTWWTDAREVRLLVRGRSQGAGSVRVHCRFDDVAGARLSGSELARVLGTEEALRVTVRAVHRIDLPAEAELAGGAYVERVRSVPVRWADAARAGR